MGGFFGQAQAAGDWFEDTAWSLVNTSAATTITANSTAHTKGAWTQLVASSSANSSFIVVAVNGVNSIGTNTATLLDIGTGASGSETSIFENIAIGCAGSTGNNLGVVFGVPFKIASGTRISARIQSVVTGGKTAVITVFLIDAGNYDTAPTSVDVIGADTANSKGISFSGASGSWTEAIASTSKAYRAICCSLSAHNAVIAGITIQNEIGVGASGSEVSFGAGRYLTSTNEIIALQAPYSYLFGRKIPQGSRLAVKHNIAANPDRYGFVLVGIP